MKQAAAVESRPYHHGDLSRALVDAARRLLESEGPNALSLRPLARQARVSPAAPDHHFKDKGELLAAVAHEGWTMLNAAMAQARNAAPSPDAALIELGVAYVCFAREHPALYRVMYDSARDEEALPATAQDGDDSPYCQVRNTLRQGGATPDDKLELELITVAAWCAAHGLAEMANFHQFTPLKQALGGEEPFLRAVLQRLGLFPRRPED